MSLAQPLFILGSPRSFTSLLCAMLGQHPQAYGVPELNLFAAETLNDLSEMMVGLRQFQMHGLLRTVAQLYTGEQTITSLEMAQRWLFRRSDRTTGEIYWEICRQVAPLRIVDKSPVYSTKPEILQRIYQSFPDAKFLHLIRHPRSQGKSMMTVAEGMMTMLSGSIDHSTDPPTVDPQYLWVKMQRNILNFLAEVPPSQQMCLRGEDILSDTRSYFEEISKWLNLDWNESIYESMLHPETSPYACLGPYGAHLGNDPNFLKSPHFSPREIPPNTLVGSLPWRNDGKGFISDVIKLAQELGYE
ncbi:MAG: sulfotransferase [Oscillatoria sp. PMC 1068.18]|nr:sulfotransferase [Oscillatoria sp. PMC 1076.18]MEC4991546.1 sulfotransferase [Oscillatoria sp. PMC 1068.18]